MNTKWDTSEYLLKGQKKPQQITNAEKATDATNITRCPELPRAVQGASRVRGSPET